MKNFYFLLLFLFLTASAIDAFATHGMAGDITYQCLGGNQYLIKVAFYRYCGGADAPDCVNLTIESASTNSEIDLGGCGGIKPQGVAALPIPGTGQPILVANGTECNAISCQFNNNGVEEWIYESIVTFPSLASDWLISTNISDRNSVNMLVNGSFSTLYLETTLNNLDAVCNNSPVFSAPGVKYICSGINNCYNPQISDPEGNSITTYLAAPMGYVAGNPFLIDLPYVSGYSAASPLTSSTPVSFNSNTGEMCIAPVNAGEITNFDLIVEEYSGGTLISRIRRSIQIQVLNCNLPDIILVTEANCTAPSMPICIEATSMSAIDPGTFSWDFGGSGYLESGGCPPSNTACSTNVCFSYDLPGNYTVTFTINNGSCANSYIQNILVGNIICDFISNVACPGSPTNFTATPSCNLSSFDYYWSFGDGANDNAQNPSHIYSIGGTYNVTMEIYNPLSSDLICSITKSITIPPTPNVIITPSSPTICAGDILTLTANGADFYSWSSPFSLTPSMTVNPAATTTYTVVGYNNSTFCNSSASVTVLVDQVQTFGFAIPGNICVGENVCFPVFQSAGTSNNPTYSWNFGPNANPSTTSSITTTDGCTTFLTAGTHTVSFTGTNECGSFTTTNNVNVNGNPVVNLGGDRNVCEGNTIPITPINASTGSSLTWAYQYQGQPTIISSGSSTNVLGISTADNFNVTVTATNSTGCQTTDELHVDIIHPPVATALASTICQGGTATLQAVGGSSSFNYAWLQGNNFIGYGSSIIVYPTSQSTTYTLVAVSSDCAFNSDITINTSSPPTVALVQHHSVCSPTSVIANASGGASPYTYTWPAQPPSSNYTYIVSQPVSSIGIPWSFNMTVTDAVGCVVTSPYISVGNDPFWGAFFPSFPSAVDISSEDWKVTDTRGSYYSNQAEYNATSYHLYVLNRWGTNDIWDISGVNVWGLTGFFGDPIRWDGYKYNGKSVNDGSYPFVLYLWNCGNSETFTGWATITGSQFKKCNPPDNTPLARIHNNQTLVSSATWANKDHYVSGTLRIPSGKVLNIIGSDVKFSEASKIVIEPGGKLNINGSTLSACANDYLWDGIEVRGNRALAHTPNNQGSADIKNSIIRDAQIGIFAGKIDDSTGVKDASSSGGIVKISQNSKMINNGIDIYLTEYTKANNLNEIKETDFGEPSALFGSKEAPHILIEGAHGLKLHDNSFTKGDIGAMLKKVNDIEIYNTVFNSVITGIKADSSQQLEIRDNTFNSGLYGIQLTSCTDFQISDNEFNDTKIPISTKDSKEGSGSEIKNNKFNRPEKGIHFENDHHTKLDMACNEFNQFSHYAVKSENTILKNQGTATEGAGNKFISASSLTNSHLDHNGTSLEYFYDPIDAASFSNPGIMSSAVTKVPSGRDRNCNKMARLSSAEQQNNEPYCFTTIQNKNDKEFAKNGGVCPTYSVCDSASLRNSYLPISNLQGKSFKVRWNVFRNDDGTDGLDSTTIINNMNVLNNNFSNSKIDFSIDTIVYINNTYFNNNLIINDSQNDSVMKATYGGNYDNVINIYALKSLSPQLEGAYARYPFKFGVSSGGMSVTMGVVITQGYLKSPYAERMQVITHEFGHIFGLYHTFEGTDKESCENCREIPNGSGNSLNGDIAGDFIDDTPAMPSGYDCNDNNSILDTCSGNVYLNMPKENYMNINISTTLCINKFTPQQTARMHCMAEHHLANWIILGKEDLQKPDFKFEVFPNPANDKLYIHGNFPLPATAELFDITGRKVIEQLLKINTSTIDIRQLSNGFYMLRLETEMGIHNTRIIKE